jgi:hypothetical protein
VAQLSRGRVSVPAQAALSGSPKKASGFAGGSYSNTALADSSSANLDKASISEPFWARPLRFENQHLPDPAPNNCTVTVLSSRAKRSGVEGSAVVLSPSPLQHKRAGSMNKCTASLSALPESAMRQERSGFTQPQRRSRLSPLRCDQRGHERLISRRTESIRYPVEPNWHIA